MANLPIKLDPKLYCILHFFIEQCNILFEELQEKIDEIYINEILIITKRIFLL